MGDEPKLPRRLRVPGRFSVAWWRPNVIGEAHHDAPLSPRGRAFFYVLVGAIVVGGIVLILVVR